MKMNISAKIVLQNDSVSRFPAFKPFKRLIYLRHFEIFSNRFDSVARAKFQHFANDIWTSRGGSPKAFFSHY